MNKNFFISAIIGVVSGFFNGLFGSGGGTVVVPCLEKFLKFEEHKAHATAIAIILPVSIVSLFIYLNGISIDWKTVILVALGGMIGGFCGAKFLKRVPAKWLHRIFGIFMLVGAWRMIV